MRDKVKDNRRKENKKLRNAGWKLVNGIWRNPEWLLENKYLIINK